MIGYDLGGFIDFSDGFEESLSDVHGGCASESQNSQVIWADLLIRRESLDGFVFVVGNSLVFCLLFRK